MRNGLLAARRAVAGLALLLGAPAWAQGPVLADEALRARLDAAFEALLAQPGDVDRVLEYARLSVEAGDYESAIGQLERLLLMSSKQPTVQADLGIFYHRIGSDAVARYHLRAALADPRLPQAVAQRAQEVLDTIEARTRRSRFSGALTLGARYQSNANSGPSSGAVLANGIGVTLDERFREQDDVDGFAVLFARHEYDLQVGNAARLETDLLAFGNLHADSSDLNSRFVELAPGLRFDPAPGAIPGLSIRPHLLAAADWNAGALNSAGWGYGLAARYAPGGRFGADARVERRRRDYRNSTDRPANDRRDGHETLFSLEGRYGFSADLVGVLRGSIVDREAKDDALSATEYGLAARLVLEHAAPLPIGTGRWQSSAGVSWFRTGFERPDPVVDPLRARRDRELRFALRTSVPLSRMWRMQAEAAYSDVSSNLPNFERDNVSVTLSATRRF